jgi:hypothetical protein
MKCGLSSDSVWFGSSLRTFERNLQILTITTTVRSHHDVFANPYNNDKCAVPPWCICKSLQKQQMYSPTTMYLQILTITTNVQSHHDVFANPYNNNNCTVPPWCSSLLISCYMFRFTCIYQGAYTDFAKLDSVKIFLQWLCISNVQIIVKIYSI